MPEVTRPTTVVFDLGGVLIDWDPRHLYRQLFEDPDEMEAFLAEVTTAEWNAHQDAGRPWAEAIEILVAEHPERRELIEAFHRRWPEMLAGEIPGTVEVLAELRAAGTRLVALSNWSAEMFPVARERFDFLAWFEGIVISGEVGVNKPDRRIFGHLVERFGIEPAAGGVHRRLRRRTSTRRPPSGFARSSSPTQRPCGASWRNSGSFRMSGPRRHRDNHPAS